MAPRHRRSGAGPLAELRLERHVWIVCGGGSTTRGSSGGSRIGGGGVAGGKELRVAGREVAVVGTSETAERADGHAGCSEEKAVAKADANAAAATLW